MSTLTRRSAFAAFAAAFIAPIVASTAAHAQATVGPAGAIPSTTAPGNSEGTPAGGTGVIGRSNSTSMPMSSSAGAAPPPRRRRRRHARRRASTAQ